MQGYFALILHAHLPFVRHPEHEKFLEESWLFEAVTETYLPLVRLFEGWAHDGVKVRLTLSLSPTLCTMLTDPLLQTRYERHLRGLIELAEKEIRRTHWERAFQELARMYYQRLTELRDTWRRYDRNLLAAFRRFQDAGQLEIITTAATHAVLPLFANHPPTLRAQILTARDHYRAWFGRDPRGFWLPECAYSEDIEPFLQEANIRWFVVDAHGLLHAQPRPRHGVFAPVFTPNGLAVFGRDPESSRQVWSRHEGYPGDLRYRDFYRDIGFDLDFDYVRPYLPSPDHRGFTGFKYYRITGGTGAKEPYHRATALQAAAEHAGHFLSARLAQFQKLSPAMDQPPIVVAPYDAELFGHWWYEGPEFLDYFVRKAAFDQHAFALVTPDDYLREHSTHPVARPAPSSWGEEGYYRAWVNETNAWIYPHLHAAQDRMTELARKFVDPPPLFERALKQAARELLLAQASDWPFILRTGTSPDYARRRLKDHLVRFLTLYEQLRKRRVDEPWLRQLEQRDAIFPNLNVAYWA